MLVSLIVAVAENGVIGKDNQLLWKLSDDLKRFKQLTTNHCIIMGRKTFESIGKALPNRTNIVISRNTEIAYPNTIICGSLTTAIERAAILKETEVFIIGGAEIYKQSVHLADKIYLTLVKTTIDGDAFFNYTMDDWKVVEETNFNKDEKNEYDSSFIILERNKI